MRRLRSQGKERDTDIDNVSVLLEKTRNDLLPYKYGKREQYDLAGMEQASRELRAALDVMRDGSCPRRAVEGKERKIIMEKTLILIGGGELKTKETLRIDAYIAEKAKERAGERRAYGLFIPTASHDSMPYFNSFRKTYTSVFDIKADVALTVYGEMSFEKLREKFLKADFLYVGGGDTLFMLEYWKKTGLYSLICDAMNAACSSAGCLQARSAGFRQCTQIPPEAVQSGASVPYAIYPGLNWIKDTISPHYNLRALDFDEIISYNKQDAIGLEDQRRDRNRGRTDSSFAQRRRQGLQITCKRGQARKDSHCARVGFVTISEA